MAKKPISTGAGAKPAKPTTKAPPAERLILANRKVRFEFEVLDRIEAGIVLMGSEVKSLRAGEVQWGDAHAGMHHGELFLYGLHIGAYRQAVAAFAHQPRQPRKLLLHRREIERWMGKLEAKGLTCVPERLYFKGPHVKVDLCLVRGKEKSDKRKDLQKRDQQREIQRIMRRGR
jgi:SsrA-binding protein